MSRYQLSTTVAAFEPFTDDIFRLSFHAPELSRAARPGQFVMLRVTDGCDPLLRRPFSVHRAGGEDGTLDILVKVVGKGTQMLAALRSGDPVDLLGPLGHGFALPAQGPVCLVGGGIGTAPLLFLAMQLREQLPQNDILVLVGARTAVEITALARPFEELHLPVRLATDDGSAGHHGLVGDLLERLSGRETPAMVYSCGPHPMLAAVARICRDKEWLCQVSTEAVMACGMGACLGCALPRSDGNGYLHVCKQGPVIDAGEVRW